MKYVHLLLLLGVSFGALAQDLDTSFFTVSYPDSIAIEVEIELEDPLQDIFNRLYLGIGSAGSPSGTGNLAALHASYLFEMSPYFGVSLSGALAPQDFSNRGRYYLEVISHKSVWSQVKKVPMSMRLYDYPDTDDSYFASHPLNVRQQVLIDGGLYFTGLADSLGINVYEDENTYLTSPRQDYVSALLGVRYARTRNVTLRVNDSKTLKFFTKLSVAVSANLAVSQGIGLILTDSVGSNRVATVEESKLVEVQRIGVGMDLSYEMETSKPGLLIRFDLKGRALPSFSAPIYFRAEMTNTLFQQDTKLTPRILLMPSVSVGFAF